MSECSWLVDDLEICLFRKIEYSNKTTKNFVFRGRENGISSSVRNTPKTFSSKQFCKANDSKSAKKVMVGAPIQFSLLNALWNSPSSFNYSVKHLLIFKVMQSEIFRKICNLRRVANALFIPAVYQGPGFSGSWSCGYVTTSISVSTGLRALRLKQHFRGSRRN